MIEEPDQVLRSQVAGLQLVCFLFSVCFFLPKVSVGDFGRFSRAILK